MKLFIMAAAAALMASAGSIQAGSGDEIRTFTQHQVFSPGSVGAGATALWLSQRKDEGQYSKYTDLPIDLSKVISSIVTVDISGTINDQARASTGRSEQPDLSGPGGTTLPPTGSPGETITITSCTAGQQTMTQVFVWVPDGNGGGGWVSVSISYTANKNVACVPANH